MDELRPCPFCGGDGSLSVGIEEKTVYGSCWTCGARGSGIRYKNRPSVEDVEKAIRAWNRRVNNGQINTES